MRRPLSAVLQELQAREPLFHRREVVDSHETFDRETAEDFWEVGASGAAYDRDTVRAVVLRRLAREPEDAMVADGWEVTDPAVRPLGEDTYLLTYVLHQPGRVTRRATVWRHTDDRGWHALYHQGTVVGTG